VPGVGDSMTKRDASLSPSRTPSRTPSRSPSAPPASLSPAAATAVRVRTDVAALPKLFDYVVPPEWDHDVRVGSRVRVPLHGRSVRGWVVEADVATQPGVDLLPLKSWLGWGPPPALVELADWAAWRWAGPASFFLRVASPATVVRAPPAPPPRAAAATRAEGGVAALPSGWDLCLDEAGATVVRLPPVIDLIDLVLAVVDDPAVCSRDGSTIVLVPSTGWAERLTARLRRRGCAATGSWEEARAGWPVVVGSRAGAWAPVPRLAAAVILDAHDAAYREETTPTYSALDVLVERTRREGSRCLLASPVPPVRLAADMGLRRVRPPAHEERIGWPTLERVDRRGADPRTGMFSEEFVRLARAVLGDPTAAARGPLVCVYNRRGGARLLACRHCGELARCTRCGAAAARPRDEEVLVCSRCA
jgi:primosomal protein N' (replication factor Y) (superfamily II helicase)